MAVSNILHPFDVNIIMKICMAVSKLLRPYDICSIVKKTRSCKQRLASIENYSNGKNLCCWKQPPAPNRCMQYGETLYGCNQLSAPTQDIHEREALASAPRLFVAIIWSWYTFIAKLLAADMSLEYRKTKPHQACSPRSLWHSHSFIVNTSIVYITCSPRSCWNRHTPLPQCQS